MPALFRVPTCPKMGLTKTFIDALPLPPGGAYTITDNDTPHLRLRVSESGVKSFFMWKRWEKGAKSAAARSIGQWGVISLADARETARAWEDLRKKGIDPKAMEEDERRAKAEKVEAARDTKFAIVVERYLTAKRNKGRRKAEEDAKDFRRDCLPLWKDKPVATITKRDVEKVIDRILERGRHPNARTDRKAQATNVATKINAFFEWCVRNELVERSPCRLIEKEELIGKQNPRERNFSRDELFAFMRAVDRMPYPYGPLYKVLLLTGGRLNEIMLATWPEIDMGKGTLTIPAERFKSGRTNVIALSTEAMSVVAELPRWAPVKGDPRHFLFSALDGTRAVNNIHDAKDRVNARMVRTLRALARKRGDDPDLVTIEPWVNHDLRRVVRTGMSELRVKPMVAELILGHNLPALWGTYDKFTYLEEKKEALELWAAHLRGVIGRDPEEKEPPANVLPFRRAV